MRTKHSNFFFDERGSATGEFVLIALPLFLPALFFFLSMSNLASSEMEVSFIAREAARAFTTGNDDEEAHSRVRLLLSAYEREGFSYSVNCSHQPCITPGAGVELTLFQEESAAEKSSNSIFSSNNFWEDQTGAVTQERLSLARATSYVDKWQ